MTKLRFTAARSGEAVPHTQVPELTFADFRRSILNAVGSDQRVAALFADSSAKSQTVNLYGVLSDSGRGLLHIGRTTLDSDRFPSLTPDCPQVHLFEREIAEQFGVVPERHPWLKPVRFQPPFRHRIGDDWTTRT